MKKPLLAALLNIIPGTGYLYLGIRPTFAVLLLIATASSFIGGFHPAVIGRDKVMTFWEILTYVMLSAAFVVDAYKEGERLNRRSKEIT